MASNAPYLDQIEFKADGIYIGGEKLPGAVLRHSVILQPGPDEGYHPEVNLTDHWTVNLTFVTGKPPILHDPIVRDEETGRVDDAITVNLRDRLAVQNALRDLGFEDDGI